MRGRGRPAIEPGMKVTGISIPSALLAAVREAARARDMSASAYVRVALREHLAREQKTKA